MSLRVEDAGRPRWSSHDPWSPVKHTPGAYPSSPRSDIHPAAAVPHSINAAVRDRREEYVRKKTLRVKVGTWNVAAGSGAQKDLGGWFAHGLGVKGLSRQFNDLNTAGDESSDEEVESVEDQEQRRAKKKTTLPKNDSAAVAGDDEVGLYVLGLQEVVDISSVTDAIRPYTDPNPGKKWKNALKKSLPHGYVKIVEQQLLGLLLLVYAAPSVAAEISSVDSTSVGTGAMGYLGNKGAVSARLLLGDTTRLLLVNSHLAAGADAAALQRRIWDTSQIVSRTKFSPVRVDGETAAEAESIGDEDFAFWFGDLNYRLDDIPGEDVRRLLLLHTRNEYDVLNKSKRRIDSELGYIDASPPEPEPVKRYEFPDVELPATDSSADPILDPKSDPASLYTTIHSLLAHDQLRAQQRAGKAFHEGWREGEINFLPTYKYDVGSVAMFDSGEKKRSPSWCDRILFRTRKDREVYKERVREQAVAKKKDEEMKKRGLDTEAAQEAVLFDYDPDTDGVDGTGDDDDDYDEYEDQAKDAALIEPSVNLEDNIQVEDYVSHQRVLSSDHKPLTAVFTVTYDAVIPELKAKVHHGVAKDFDRAENETRPSVTVILDHPFETATTADDSTETTELKVVDFGDVRFDVPTSRGLTVANTGQSEALFGFVDRPVESGQVSTTAPSWLTMNVDSETMLNLSIPGQPSINPSGLYKLLPGETTRIELTVDVSGFDLVRELNSGNTRLDDVLVLRIVDGRDYFIPIRGRWLQSCFTRTLNELVRVSDGVRTIFTRTKRMEAQSQTSDIVYHSAPRELFALTDSIPALIERTVAEWGMLHDDEQPPWKSNTGGAWPFKTDSWHDVHEPERSEQLAAIREALDTASPVEDRLGPEISSLHKLDLLSETLMSFLSALRDGIVTAASWASINDKLAAAEKPSSTLSNTDVQDIVMEELSGTPVHNVSWTFITFMLMRVISELSTEVNERVSSPVAPPKSRSRSSTVASEAPSELSITSGSTNTGEPLQSTSPQTGKPKMSFFSALPRRAGSLGLRKSRIPPNTGTVGTGASTPTSAVTRTSLEETYSTPLQRRHELAQTYADVFAPLVIRSEDDSGDRDQTTSPNTNTKNKAKVKTKERKMIEGRKVKALMAFLDLP